LRGGLKFTWKKQTVDQIHTRCSGWRLAGSHSGAILTKLLNRSYGRTAAKERKDKTYWKEAHMGNIAADMEQGNIRQYS